MTTESGGGRRRPRITMRETDAYVEHVNEEAPPERPSPWIRGVFQPVTVGILVGCIAWSIAHFLGVTTSLTPVTLFWLTPVAMALVGFVSQRGVQRRFHGGADRLRVRLVQLALMFLVVKLAGLLNDSIPALITKVRGWTQQPWSFFDTTTVVAFALGTVAWFMATLTARDLDALVDPGMYVGETDAATRLVKRYFAGGAVLLIFTALARVNVGALISMENPRIRTPILHVLVYFFLGLVMLGQIRFSRLFALWHYEKVTVADNLGTRWIRYTLAFIALAALIAFALPTGYTIGILDAAATLIYYISYGAMVLYTLVLWPIMMLLALLSGKQPATEAPATPNIPFTLPPPPESAGGAGGGAWWGIVRSVAFWVVLLGVIVYLVRSYLRDRADFRESLRRFAPWRWILGAWHAVGRWLRGWGRTVGETVPTLLRRILRSRTRGPGAHRRRGRDLREQLRYHYLTTLDRAREEGVPRREVETPYEYGHKLAPHLSEGSEALADLTQAFVEARYSTHPVTAEDVAAGEANAEEIRRGLRPKEK